jgi:uncharacterized RDD family membrane protein YckC
VTFPDPYGSGQEAIQPPPGQGYNPPPPNQGFNQPPPAGQGYNAPPPGQGYGRPDQAPPPQPGFAPAPPVPAGYGYGQYPAVAVPQGMYVDQMSGLLLPDGTELASVGRRIGAYFLAIPLWIVTLGIGYIIWGLIAWGNGQTPALQVLGMRCWRPETNRVAGFWFMALREIPGRIIDGILGFITLITSLVLMVTGRERKALHDWIAGTVVLRDPNKVLDS